MPKESEFINQQIGSFIKGLRLYYLLSEEQFIKILSLNLSVDELKNIENKGSVVYASDLYKITSGFKINVNKLLQSIHEEKTSIIFSPERIKLFINK